MISPIVNDKFKVVEVCILGDDKEVIRAATILSQKGCKDFKHSEHVGQLSWLQFKCPVSLNPKFTLKLHHVKLRYRGRPSVQNGNGAPDSADAPAQPNDQHPVSDKAQAQITDGSHDNLQDNSEQVLP